MNRIDTISADLSSFSQFSVLLLNIFGKHLVFSWQSDELSSNYEDNKTLTLYSIVNTSDNTRICLKPNIKKIPN